MAFIPVLPAEVDAKSPIDDYLMGKIKDDLDALNEGDTGGAGAGAMVWDFTGRLKYLRALRPIGPMHLSAEFIPTACRYVLRKSGTSPVKFDIRALTNTRTPIMGITSLFTGAVQSVARAWSAVSTQSITRNGAGLSVISITSAKPTHNIQSIVSLGNDFWQINLDGTVDPDIIIKRNYIKIASATSGGNNGSFTVVDVRRGGGNNVVVTNASGVAQAGAAGTLDPCIISFNFTNPAPANFSVGSSINVSGTTASDGTFTIFDTNQGANNIWANIVTIALQAGAAGTVHSNDVLYNLSAAASTTAFIVGEVVAASGHTSGSSDGNLEILGVNVNGGNNLWLRSAGVLQASPAGTINSNHWRYTFLTNPTGLVALGDYMSGSGFASYSNGRDTSLIGFIVRDITATSVAVYNRLASAAGVGGTFRTMKRKISFSSDQSAYYTTDSWVQLQATTDPYYDDSINVYPFKVVEVNRGGGANYNIIISAMEGEEYPDSGMGWVAVEGKSIFTTTPVLDEEYFGDNTIYTLSLLPKLNLKGVSTDLKTDIIPANTPLAFYLLQDFNGDPVDLTVSLS